MSKEEMIIAKFNEFNNAMELVVKAEEIFIFYQDRHDVEGMKKTLELHDKLFSDLLELKKEMTNTVYGDSIYYSASTVKAVKGTLEILVSSTNAFKQFSEVGYKLVNGGADEC